MGNGRGHLVAGTWRLWRRAVGAVVIYALVVQGLLLGFAGVPAAVHGSPDLGLPAFEVCLSAAPGDPLAPSDLPGHHGDNHCIFCFGGAHASLGAPPSFALLGIGLKGEDSWRLAADWRLSAFFEHSIGPPRAPPTSA